jgi:hypothetical protein
MDFTIIRRSAEITIFNFVFYAFFIIGSYTPESQNTSSSKDITNFKEKKSDTSVYTQKISLPAQPVHHNSISSQIIILYIEQMINRIMSTTNACFCKHKKSNINIPTESPNRCEDPSMNHGFMAVD